MEYKVNTHEHGMDLRHHIDSFKYSTGLDYRRTRAILENLFRRNEGNRRYKLLNLSLKEFYSFIINNAEQLKDLKEFEGERNEQMTLVMQKVQEFTIPHEEYYYIDSDEKKPRVYEKNVYRNYNSSLFSGTSKSKPERLFERHCENSSKVKYIYKNGDSGQEYLSIVYALNNGIKRNFYPDYIVELENKEIWIVETKGGEESGQTRNIDIQAENKFIQLKRFATEHNYNFALLGNGRPYYSNTEYTEDMSGSNWQPIEDIF